MNRLSSGLIGGALLAALFLVGCRDEAKPVPAAEKPATIVREGPNRIEEALVIAKEKGRNLVVEYYGSDCPFCVEMDDEVFTDEFVKDMQAEEVVYLRLTQDKDAWSFEDRWGRQGTPTFVVLTPENEQKGELLTGKIDVTGMMDLLGWAKNPEGPQPAIQTGGS